MAVWPSKMTRGERCVATFWRLEEGPSVSSVADEKEEEEEEEAVAEGGGGSRAGRRMGEVGVGGLGCCKVGEEY